MITPDLIERVRSGEGADTCLDMDVMIALDLFGNGRELPPLSASLDAVALLIREKLPGWWGSVEFGRRNVEAEILAPDNDPQSGYSAYAKSPARALLCAALLALSAKDAAHADR